MRRIFILLTVILSAFTALRAQAPEAPDSLTVGFVTCYPGPEIFELYGHEAVRISGRVQGEPVDVIFNYGLFDFDSPNFVGRFVKGETDYMTGAEPTSLFLMPYRERGSRVVERVLPLSQAEALRMYYALANDVLPANSTYRYKYFTANCATKPIDHLNRITNGRYLPTKEVDNLTYRKLLEEYNVGYPWYQLGIDLVLGSMLDAPITYAQATFVPMELDKHYFGNMPERELVHGEGDGNSRGAPTPWFLTPLCVFWTIFAISLFLLLKTLYRRHIAEVQPTEILKRQGTNIKVATTLWTLLQGLAGCLVWFLCFLSEHEGTSPNWNILWLTPIWLLIPILIWIKGCAKVTRTLCLADALLTTLTLCLWPLLPQSLNPAMVPMMLTTAILTLLPVVSCLHPAKTLTGR
ncbi:MAG: DUF4105 domain-containing protein [Muribaculaceae bacterium]|nr:DUF4105 domain-containing protein [Muribaculaceae bacterium]